MKLHYENYFRLVNKVVVCGFVMPLDKKRGKGGKFKRNNNKKEIKLSGDDLEYLVEHTSYEAPEIMEWFRYFKISFS